MFRTVVRFLSAALGACACVFAGGPALALDPAQAITRYVHRTWTTEAGLPQNTVYASVVSSDGYLWLGTDEGLVRFDGLRFVVFDRGNTPALRDPFVFSLHEARDGSLWAGTDRGGLTRLRDGRFTHYGSERGLPSGRVQAIADARDGTVWVGLRGGGLARVGDETVQIFTSADGLSSDNVLAVLEDRAGRLWVGTDRGLDRLEGSRFVRFDTSHGLPPGGVRALREDRQGRLWVGTIDGMLGARLTGGGLAVLRGDRFDHVSRDWLVPSSAVMTIHEDHGGTLWIGTAGGGLVRVHEGKVAHWLLGASPVDDLVYDIAEDAERNLWLGTAPGGLHRLRDSAFVTWTADDGLTDEVVEALYEDAAGVTWVGTHAGGICQVLPPARPSRPVTCLSTPQGLAHLRVNAMTGDGAGGLWVGTQGGLNRLVGRTFTRYGVEAGLPIAHVNALLRDRHGRLWVGTWGGGVARQEPDAPLRFVPLPGTAGLYVTSLLEDSTGRLWIGTTDGLVAWSGNTLVNMTVERGLPTGIEALHADRDGALWIGTRRDGLYRYTDDRLVHYTVREGLFDNLVGTILEDDTGHFWFTCNKGIFRVSRAQLLAFAEGRRTSVESRAFDTADGMRNRECNFGQGRLEARDGRLWFATVGGVAVIDPRRLLRNTVPPPVHLEQVTVDGAPLPRDGPTVLDLDSRRLEFGFVGLSLAAPARVRYRYQLEGFDPDWVDGRESRIAQYTNLSAGTYRFRVIAANGDGVWNSSPTSFAFVVERPIWQRPSSVFGAIGGLWLLGLAVGYRRMHTLRREQAQQAQFARELISLQEAERQRLASELHDGIGQQLLVIGNWARLSLDVIDGPERARTLLQEIVETTSTALREVRTITHDLQPYDLAHVGLRAVLVAMLGRVAESSGLIVTHEIDEVDGLLDDQAAISLFRIVQEATNNIVKHAQATGAHVRLQRREGALDLTVSDDGRGFPPGRDPRQAAGGFGLRSLTERTRLLGGSHAIETTGRGTTVHVVVPISTETPGHAQ